MREMAGAHRAFAGMRCCFTIVLVAACGAPAPRAAPAAAAPAPAASERCGPTEEVAAPLAPQASRCTGPSVRLADGRVLAIGEDCAELFAAGRWTAAAKPRPGAADATLTALADGDALLVGGHVGDADAIAEVSRFDAKRGTWRAVAPLGTGRFGHAAL